MQAIEIVLIYLLLFWNSVDKIMQTIRTGNNSARVIDRWFPLFHMFAKLHFK